MGKIEIDHTGSGGGITLSSDGTDLLLDGSAVGGSEGAGYPADQSFTVTNSGSGAYTFAGGATGDNATLTLIRGHTYKFSVNASGHPFRINTSNTTGTSAAYVNGTAVINNGAAVGDIYFTVPDTAPDTLYYNCEYHSSMAGTINVSNVVRIDKANDSLLVGKSVRDNTTDGHRFDSSGFMSHVRDGNATALYNRKTSDGDIVLFRKDGATVGSIGTNGSTLYIGSTEGADAHIGFGNQIIRPVTSSGGSRDNAIDLGYNGMRFRDIYLSGGVYLGGTGSANKLSDVETGTWTPAFQSVTVSNYASQQGKYTKIGSLVNCTVSIDVSSGLDTSDGSGVKINLPFTAIANEEAAVVSLGRYINILGSKATSVNNYRLASSSLLLYQAHDSSITYNTINSGGFLQMAFTYRTTA